MIDSHSHLFDKQFTSDLDECINRAKKENINKIVLVGFSKTTNEKAQALSKQFDIFYPTAGIHPSEVDENYEKEIQQLEEFLKKNKVIAIGECGLDYHYTKEFVTYQKIVFEKQIELAIAYDLPIIIHMRDATKDTYDILKKYKGRLEGVMHCYSGSYEMALEFIKIGFYISIGGPVTFKKAIESKEIVKNIDINKLLIETDCPYLAPDPFRGKRNESSYLKYICEEIACLRNESVTYIDEMTTRNAQKLFKI